MAKTRITKNGKFGSVDDSKLAAAQAKGWTVAPAGDHAEPDADQAGGGSDGDADNVEIPSLVSGPAKAAKWMAGGALTDPAFRAGAAKFLTGGFTDSAASLGAGLGAASQTLADNGGAGDALNAGLRAAKQGGNEQRAYEDEQFKKSPLAYGHGAVSGLAGGVPLAGGGASLDAQIVRGGAMGGAQGVGMGGDEEGLADDFVAGSIGSLMGAGLPMAGAAATEALPAIKGLFSKAAGSPLGKSVMQTGRAVVEDVAGKVPGVKPLMRFGKTLDRNIKAATSGKSVAAPSPADDFAGAVDEIDAPATPLEFDVQPLDPKAPKPVLPVKTDAMQGMSEIMEGPKPPVGPDDVMGAMDEIDNGLPAWMNDAKAQDWGTRPRTDMGGFNGGPAQQSPNLPPPDPALIDYFMQQGATREQALAQSYAVMAKQFAGPQRAVGRQRAAAPFTGQPQAPIATPKGRNRASAPFKK